jgi:endo-1,4-beta-xylanase
VTTGNDAGTLLAWAWAASRGVDALEYLDKNNPELKDKLELNKLVVTGFSRCGKAALAAGLFDDRFKVVNPGASGCGGAAVYRYASSGNEYPWGVSPGNEVLGDKIRHQGHNSNEMLARFLNYPRIYETGTHGYGERLPYDHHEIIAAIAPRAVLITTATDDYANNAEGDAIGFEGARHVFRFLDAEKMLGLNIRTTGEKNPYGFGDGHWQSDKQVQNLVDFSNMVFFGTSLSIEQENIFYSNPYYPTFDKYYGGIESMMPWITKAPLL